MPTNPSESISAGSIEKSPVRNIRSASLYNPTLHAGHPELEAIEARIESDQSQSRRATIPQLSSSSARQAGPHRATNRPLPEDLRPDPSHEMQIAELPSGSPPAYRCEERLYGLAPRTFWIAVLLIVFFLAAGIAVGLGVGLGLLMKSNKQYVTLASDTRHAWTLQMCTLADSSNFKR